MRTDPKVCRYAKPALLATIMESERPEVVELLRGSGPLPDVEVAHA